MALSPDFPFTLGWVEIGALASIGIFLLGLYQYKSSKLESARDREEYLGNMEGKSMKDNNFKIIVDNIEFDERDSWIYSIKRHLLRPADGTIYVTVRLAEIQVPDQLWEAGTWMFSSKKTSSMPST